VIYTVFILKILLTYTVFRGQMGNIKITCRGADLVNINELKDLQGKLKTLSDENYIRLKASLEKYGYTFPAFVWKNDKELWTLIRLLDNFEVGHFIFQSARKRILHRIKFIGELKKRNIPFSIIPSPIKLTNQIINIYGKAKNG
jgi:hypothetical protein